MSLSIRTRFEILKRDNFTCQYCGGSAPVVVLEVDHVTPVSLGGSNAPDNLITSCRDCNAGKSNVSLSNLRFSPVVTVDGVRHDIGREAEMIAMIERAHYAAVLDELEEDGRECIAYDELEESDDGWMEYCECDG